MGNLFYYLYLVPLLFSAIFSLRSFRLNWPKPFRDFSVFLIATVSVEVFALLWKYILHNRLGMHYSFNNLWIYNSYLIPQYIFYLYFYYQFLTATTTRKIIKAIGIIYLIFSFANILFIQKIESVNFYTIILSNAIMIFLTIAYFRKILTDKTIIDLSKEPLVWISVGAFIFHLGCLPYFILMDYLNSLNMLLSLSLFKIIVILNTLMYSLYTIAYLCKTSSQISPR